MTPSDLAAIREAAEKATPGPWKHRRGVLVEGDYWDVAEASEPADARFIALARSAVPALLAHVEALGKEHAQALVDWRNLVDGERETIKGLRLDLHVACGLAFDHGRLLQEAATLWDVAHRVGGCVSCRSGIEWDDPDDGCGQRNPYRVAP